MNIAQAPMYATIAGSTEKMPTSIMQRVTLADAIRLGGDDEACILPGWNVGVSIRHLKKLLAEHHDVSPEKFCLMTVQEQDRITRKIQKYLSSRLNEFTSRPEASMRPESELSRAMLHERLRAWADGPLKLEKPQGSSYHHLVQYDFDNKLPGRTTMMEITKKFGVPETLVVEHDWATALAGTGIETGEVRMPFPNSCWEFRISGVRVLTMVHVDGEYAYVFCVYGRDRSWVCDDYIYVCDFNGTIDGQPHNKANDNYEFRRVFDLCHANIRASCILLDARVGQCERETVSQKLVQKRVAERKAPPRDYQVVRLLRDDASRNRRVRAAGAGTGSAARTPQGGHLRRGTWVHFDDPDSGEVQYANEGGFFVSKTWRRWHFAGDLKRMIKKEYRL